MPEIDPLDKAAAAQLDFTAKAKKGGKKAAQADAAAPGEAVVEGSAEGSAAEAQPETAVITTKTVYIVEEERKILLSGQKVIMRKGKVIDPAGYGGEAGIAALKAQGLKIAEAQQPV